MKIFMLRIVGLGDVFYLLKVRTKTCVEGRMVAKPVI